MKRIISEQTTINAGWFSIKPDDIVIIDIIKNIHTLGDYLNFTKVGLSESISNADMIGELKSKGIWVDGKIERLIQSGFFKEGLSDSHHGIYDQVAIIKGRTTYCRHPSVLIRDGFPEDLYLVPPDVTFQVAYIISHFVTKTFLNIHNMDRVFIMSEPLEKLNEEDDNLIIEWDPSYGHCITTALYSNPYSGDTNAGYLFFI